MSDDKAVEKWTRAVAVGIVLIVAGHIVLSLQVIGLYVGQALEITGVALVIIGTALIIYGIAQHIRLIPCCNYTEAQL
ncbi:MAG: hypothetical protein QXZ31_03720 [Thermofilaceae archaeon]